MPPAFIENLIFQNYFPKLIWSKIAHNVKVYDAIKLPIKWYFELIDN